MQVEWRGVTGGADLDAWADALAAIEAVDRSGEVVTRQDLEEELSLSYFDPAEDARLGWLDDRVVAWGTVLCVPNDRQWRVMLAGAVVPDERGRGVGSGLLDWQTAHGRVVAARRDPGVPGWLELSAAAGDEARSALFRDFGFTPLRYYFQMHRRLGGAPDPGPVAGCVTIVVYDHTRDGETRVAHNEAFVDHFAATELDGETWRRWVTSNRHLRPDLSFLALVGDEVAGYALNFVYPDEWDALGYSEGWTHQLGVRRAHRGRGVATALLAATASAFRAEGLDVATLEVDAASPTGALALYERCGYERARTQVSWSRPVD